MTTVADPSRRDDPTGDPGPARRPPDDDHRGNGRRRVVVAAVVALGVIAVAVVWGRSVETAHPEVHLGAAPFVGRNPFDGWNWRFGWGLVGASIVAALVGAAVLTGWWWRASRLAAIATTSVAAATFATLLALTDRTTGLLYGAADRTEYLANLATTPPAGEFLRTFVERINDYTVHQRGHPPGFVLVLKAMDAIGLHGAWPIVVLSILATAVLPAAVLVTVGSLAGDDWMRRVAPLLVVAPYAMWMVTSADAVFAAVGAGAMAALAVGLHRAGPRAVGWGAVAGVLLASLLYLTYGGAMFMILPLATVTVAWRRGLHGLVPAVVSAVIGALAVVAAFTAAGFWWVAGAAATRVEYLEGSARFRTWTYFSVSSIAVALVAIGPATWAGGATGRLGRMRVLVLGGVLALLASWASQYSKAEVERIWLLFFPWIVLAGGAVVGASARKWAAGWVGVQAIVAIVLQAALVSKW